MNNDVSQPVARKLQPAARVIGTFSWATTNRKSLPAANLPYRRRPWHV